MQTADVQPTGRRLSPAHTWLWPGGQTAKRSPGLPFNGHHPIYLENGRLSWPGRLTHSGRFTQKWSHVNRRSGKVCLPLTGVWATIVPLSHTANRYDGILVHNYGGIVSMAYYTVSKKTRDAYNSTKNRTVSLIFDISNCPSTLDSLP